jgi:hypothetical protein
MPACIYVCICVVCMRDQHDALVHHFVCNHAHVSWSHVQRRPSWRNVCKSGWIHACVCVHARKTVLHMASLLGVKTACMCTWKLCIKFSRYSYITEKNLDMCLQVVNTLTHEDVLSLRTRAHTASIWLRFTLSRLWTASSVLTVPLPARFQSPQLTGSW